MKLTSMMIAFMALFCVGAAARRYNLGITLSSGYGTASVFVDRGRNDSYIDVARVNGSESYKAFMLTSAGKQWPNATISPANCSLPYDECTRWPTKNITTLNPLAPMIKELVTAAEAKFAMKFESVGVSALPRVMDPELAEEYINAALADAGARNHWYPPTWVGQHLIAALEIEGNSSYEYRPDSMIDIPFESWTSGKAIIYLVDYTHDSMTAELWSEYWEDFDRLGHSHSTTLGYDAMQACKDTTADIDERCHQALRSGFDAVFNTTNLQKGDVNWVLITGEKADDDEFMSGALRHVLKERFLNGDTVSFSGIEELSADPVYAGSRATAWWGQWGTKFLQCGNQFMTEGNVF